MTQSISYQKTPPYRVTFSFGKNWSQFSNTLANSQINQATEELKRLVGFSIKGKTFLDIGCGSGLSSLAAHRLGASSICSFDYDIYSVTTTKSICIKYASQANWKIWQDSILAPSIVDKFDVVYSWGVLHHTGDMWQAISAATEFVKPGGRFIIALYNETWTAPLWLKIKKRYNCANLLEQQLMIGALFSFRAFVRLVRFRHPFQVSRGMSTYYDAIDWLGGLPYEYATPQQVQEYLSHRGFRLVNQFLTTRTGCNEFVFERCK